MIGWTWEIVVQQVFHMMGATEHDSPALETLVQCILAVVIVLLSLAVHLFIRDWDHLSAGEGEAAEEQRDTDVNGDGNGDTQQVNGLSLWFYNKFSNVWCFRTL